MSTTQSAAMSRESTTSRFEAAFIIAMILTMSFLPNLAKFGAPAADESGSIVGELVYGTFYIFASIRLVALRDRASYLFLRTIPLTLFVGLLLASTMWSSSPIPSLRNGVEMIGTTAIGFYIVSRLRLTSFLDLLCVTFGIIAVTCAYLIVFVPIYGRSDYGASGWCGFYGEKNHFGTIMGFAIITSLVKALQSKGKKRVALGFLTFFCTVLIVGSQSATASLVAGVTALTIVIISLCRSKNFGLFAIVGFAVIAMAVGIALAASGFNSDSFFSLIGRDSTLTGRADFWPGLVQAIAEKPFFGYGYSAFFQSNGPSDQFIGNATGWWHPSHAHNSFYQIALDVGFVGLTTFAIVLLLGSVNALIFTVRKSQPINMWPIAIIVYLTIGSFTETYFGMRNTTESVLFTLAILYPVRQSFEATTIGKLEPSISFDKIRRERVAIGS